MIDSNNALRLGGLEIVSKIVDDEAVIINLTTGYYYSATGVGAVIWEMMEAGHGLRQIAEAIAARYEVTADQAERDVLALAQKLLDEKIMIPAAPAASAIVPAAVAVRMPYRGPELSRFGDLAEHFALDPPLPFLAAGGGKK
jgi:hypothetical protein